jgi:sugar O-acyltransferase (sialic acid O-acetyltransferase NeuD family)
MARVVVFGVSDTAQLAKYYLETDSEHEVVAFTVSREYLASDTYEGLPVVPWEEVETHYPPSEYHLLVAMVASGMNKHRRQFYEEGKAKGYPYISYISSHATVLTENIGENCFILEDNTIQPFVSIGDNVVLWSGNHIGHHSTVHSHVFFTSQAVLSGHCEVKEHCFIGVNATIRDSVVVEEGCLVAMGAVITRSTEAWEVYLGNPAKPMGRNSLEVYK